MLRAMCTTSRPHGEGSLLGQALASHVVPNPQREGKGPSGKLAVSCVKSVGQVHLWEPPLHLYLLAPSKACGILHALTTHRLPALIAEGPAVTTGAGHGVWGWGHLVLKGPSQPPHNLSKHFSCHTAGRNHSRGLCKKSEECREVALVPEFI